MKISAYLCNTFEDLTSDCWQSLSESNIKNYFSKYDIPLEVIRFNDPRVQIALSATIESGKNTWKQNPAMRKMYRIYDFLNSDNDYGIFIDLDTLILNRDTDIRDCFNLGENYIKCCYLGTREDLWQRRLAHAKKKDKKQSSYYYIISKMDFANSRFPNATHQHLISNTGFSLFNREFCTGFINFLDENNLNFNKREDILSYYKNFPNVKYSKNIVCNDEFLFDCYLRSDPKIISKLKDPSIKQDNQKRIICTNSGIDCDCHDINYDMVDFEDYTIQYFIDKDPIFHHTLREKHTDKTLSVMMRIFAI